MKVQETSKIVQHFLPRQLLLQAQLPRVCAEQSREAALRETSLAIAKGRDAYLERAIQVRMETLTEKEAVEQT